MRRVRYAMLWVALGASLLVAAAALALRAVVYDRSLPVRDTTVIVPPGASAREVGRLLQAEGVVRSAFAFDALARVRGRSAHIEAGEFAVPAHTSLAAVLREVTGVGRQVAVWVTVPEGFTAKEIAQTLAGKHLADEAALDAAFASGSLEVGGTKTPSLEGYLFPDTYLIPEHATAPEIAKIMTDKFRSELPPDAAERARRLGLSVPEVVTVASLVEREAKADDERPLMAGVYYNRLRLRMPLEVDATIEYTFAHHKDVITYADLARDSPYNTYKHAGLPPTPIANPGRPSLQAAFHPRSSAFLYYVYKGNGHHAFARTLAEHNANVARYLH